MISNITFDTLECVNDLKKCGLKQETAEAITKATAKALNQMMDIKEIATKKDLIALRIELQAFIVKSISYSIAILASLQTIFHFIR